MCRYLILTLGSAIFLLGCESPVIYQTSKDRSAIIVAISKEKLGNHFIGRRFYKIDYKMWGWVKKPRESWKNSQLVMFNEQKKLTSDRLHKSLGSDNNYEYKLDGYFSHQKVYEPASDSFYPEFVLTGATVISTNPPLIFPDQRWVNPRIRLLGAPEN